MTPSTRADARELLVKLGAPLRLQRHAQLVGDAAESLLAGVCRLQIELSDEFIRVGVVLHDAGKIIHSEELDRSGGAHEPAGEKLLLEHGVSPDVARICLSHARWPQMDVSLEELLVALADKLWKGVRNAELEERVIDAVASRLGKARWDVFVDLDTLFEEVSADGPTRLEHSRV